MRAATLLALLLAGSAPTPSWSLLSRKNSVVAIGTAVLHTAFLDLPKSLWASGFDAKFSPVPERRHDGPWLTWTPEARNIFERHYRDVHFPPEGCVARAAKRGFYSARTDMEWGVTSVIRDVEDQLLFGLLEGRFVAFSNRVRGEPAIQAALGEYKQQCQKDSDWLEDCYFDKLTGCTPEFLAGRLYHEVAELDRRTFKVTSEPAWFLERSQPIWDAMVKANAVHWRDKYGKAVESLALVQIGEETELLRVEAAQRLAMFRALLLQVAFRPNAALREAIAGVEKRTQLAEAAKLGPLTLVHVRRTDKAKDFIGGSQKAEEMMAFEHTGGGKDVVDTLGTFSDVLLPWLEGATGRIHGLFVMSDDWHLSQKEALNALTRRLNQQPDRIIWDPRSAQLEPKDERLLQQGNEAWGHKADLGMYILAATFAIGKRATKIVGCGSSGVSQLAAQLAGGRLGIDPNALGIWEDDALTVSAARAHLQASRARAATLATASESLKFLSRTLGKFL